mmetsp:Transcript_17989/g.18201  ORF Transcript_17989/g.18201 Transcript_17989/m.18201 type:complete len:150 (-) Transcript_17989:180-629(-)
MMFSHSKSQSSLSSFISSCLFCIAITTILIQSSNRSNYLVEAFAQQKFTGASRIASHAVSSAVPSPTSSDTTSTILFAASLPDDDVFSSITTTTDPLPSIIDSKTTSHNQEKKKKKLWHHQDSGLESKLILSICSYHVMKLMIDMIHLS